MKKFDFDLAVIGSGAAGGTAAMVAAGAGLRVALIEAGSWGGASVNRRDIPSLAAAHFSGQLKRENSDSHQPTYDIIILPF